MAGLDIDLPWDQHMDTVFENIIANRSNDGSQLRFFIGIVEVRDWLAVILPLGALANVGV